MHTFKCVDYQIYIYFITCCTIQWIYKLDSVNKKKIKNN
jgi:hypothetical protein